jgi:hypothetical protein
MNLLCVYVCYSTYQQKEPSLYVISFLNRLEQDSEIRQSLLMELIGIMMLADG